MATYHIDSEKLEAVANAYAEFEPNASTPDIEAYICADWNEGQEHQDWIDTASAAEIADWIAAGVFEDYEPA